MSEKGYFFVSQGKTYAQEASGKYLWAPDDSFWHHQTMKAIKPGDVILNYTKQTVAAISIAKAGFTKATNPFSNDNNWGREGLKVDLDLYKLPQPVYKNVFIDSFYNLQSSYQGIVNSAKGINQIYLGKITKEMCEVFLKAAESYPANKELIQMIRTLINMPSLQQEEHKPQKVVVIKKGGTPTMSETKQKINHIKSYIQSKGFTYEGNLIENFYLSLKSKPFVILAGTSGTGKTRLAKLFAESVGATEENGQYKLVPVRPDWSDSSDLFGHLDLNDQFVPGAIIDFIKEASLPENISKPYFLCLDEMNLARVEYYMSDFLSIIETRDFENNKRIKTSPLMTSEKYGTKGDAVTKYGNLCLPENLYIVGTVNMDETTFPFSKKVLDRANTIEFSLVDLMPKFEEQNEKVEPMVQNNDFLKSEYLKIAECRAEKEFIERWTNELIKINKILEKASLHVGYRVRDEFMFYMVNNKNAGNLIDEKDAFDNELMQKILPRIQGSSQSIKDLLCDLFKICTGDYSDISTSNDSASEQMRSVIEAGNLIYSNSAKKIQFMTRRFEEDGFTSYWL